MAAAGIFVLLMGKGSTDFTLPVLLPSCSPSTPVVKWEGGRGCMCVTLVSQWCEDQVLFCILSFKAYLEWALRLFLQLILCRHIRKIFYPLRHFTFVSFEYIWAEKWIRGLFFGFKRVKSQFKNLLYLTLLWPPHIKQYLKHKLVNCWRRDNSFLQKTFK